MIEFGLIVWEAMKIMSQEPKGSPLGPSAVLLAIGVYGVMRSIGCVYKGVYDDVDNQSTSALLWVQAEANPRHPQCNR